MEEKVLQNNMQQPEEKAEGNGNFNDNLHGENLNDRVKVLSPGRTVLKRFFRSKLSVVGLTILIILFLFSFVGPFISPWGETEVDTNPDNITPTATVTQVTYTDDEGTEYTAYIFSLTYSTYNKKGGISAQHWMGTDENGYDVFTRLMYGGRVSLTVGFVVVIVEMLIGIIMGGLAGYFGGWVDNLIMRVVDVLSCIPTLPIMFILAVIFENIDSVARLYYMMLIMSVMGWGGVARLVRGQILSLREQDFMLAAKSSGLSTSSKIFRHLMPNVAPQLIVSMTLGLGSAILMEATLGYLGLGAPLGSATWGMMIQTVQTTENLEFYPNLWIGAGVCITLAVLAFNFVGDGLRDAFDPKMKR